MSGADSKEIKVWNAVLKGAMALPGARVSRSDYLRKELSKHVTPEVVELAIAKTPAKAGIPASVISSIAQSSIKWHRTGVSASSFAAGLPGGMFMAATIPGDLTQFFWHVNIIMQKLVYLHGWPELMTADEDVDDETLHLMTIFIGVMFGAAGANTALQKLASAVAKEVAKRLPRQPLSKWGIYVLAKEIAKWIGIKLTKDTFARGISKMIPVFGGAVSGGITWVTFSTMSSRLQSRLEEQIQHRDSGDSEPVAA